MFGLSIDLLTKGELATEKRFERRVTLRALSFVRGFVLKNG